MYSHLQPGQFDRTLIVGYHKDASIALGADCWQVMQPFTYRTRNPHCVETVTIPAGFLTDGASVPRAFWSMLPPWGIYGQPAVVHDYLCESLMVMQDNRMVRITRQQADSIFAETLAAINVPLGKRVILEQGVDLYRNMNFGQLENPIKNPIKTRFESEFRGYVEHA